MSTYFSLSKFRSGEYHSCRAIIRYSIDSFTVVEWIMACGRFSGRYNLIVRKTCQRRPNSLFGTIRKWVLNCNISIGISLTFEVICLHLVALNHMA